MHRASGTKKPSCRLLIVCDTRTLTGDETNREDRRKKWRETNRNLVTKHHCDSPWHRPQWFSLVEEKRSSRAEGALMRACSCCPHSLHVRFTYTSGEHTLTHRWPVPNKRPARAICMWTLWHSPASPKWSPRRHMRSMYNILQGFGNKEAYE